MLAVGITNGFEQAIASYGVTNFTPPSLSKNAWDSVGFMEGSEAQV